MKLYKVLLLVMVVLLSGCKPKEPTDPNTITTVNQESMQSFFDYAIVDLDYPYGMDYFIKERITTIDFIEDYWFKMITPEALLIGNNNVTIQVINPQKEQSTLELIVKCQEIEAQYDSNNIQFDPLTQSITGYSGIVNRVIIPEKVNGIPVIHIGEEAFKEKMINELYLPNTIISIGAKAFEANQLTTFILPPSVEYVGKRAFAGNEITNLLIEERNLTFGDFVVAGNPIQEITLQSEFDFAVLGKHWKRSGLPIELLPGIEEDHGIYYSEETKTIYDVKVNFPHTISIQRVNSFIEELNIEHIGDYAFYGADLIEFTIPKTIKTIGTMAYSTSQLYELTIPENVTSIEDHSFSDCNIQILNIYDTISYFGYESFSENPLLEINVYGNEIKYNDQWEAIGFPMDLLPRYREPIPPITSWLSSREVDHMESILHENVVYGVGFTWGNDGDFQHNFDAETVDFIYKYNLQSQEKKTVMFLDPAYFATGIVKGSNDTLIVSAYRFNFDTREYFPYLLYFNFNLELIEAKPILANITLPHHLYINDSNQLLIIASPTESYPLDQVLILAENGQIIYQYENPSQAKELNFFSACVDGNDFILVGQVEKLNVTSEDNSSDKEGFIVRINENGVVWEKRYGNDYRLTHFSVLKLNQTNYLVLGTKDINEQYQNTSYLYVIDQSGNIVSDIDLDTYDVGSAAMISLVNDTIYVVASTKIGRNNYELLQFGLNMELIKRDPFIKLGFRLQILSETNNQLLIIGDSPDRYLVNNTMITSTQLHLFYYPK